MNKKALIFIPHIGDLLEKINEYEKNNPTDNKPYLIMSYVTYLAFENVHNMVGDYSVSQSNKESKCDFVFSAKYGIYKILIDNNIRFGEVEIR